MKRRRRRLAVVANPDAFAIGGADWPFECAKTIIDVTGSRGGR